MGVPYKLVRKDLPCSPCYDYASIHCTERHECMSLISTEQVSAAQDEMLEKSRGASPVGVGQEGLRRC